MAINETLVREAVGMLNRAVGGGTVGAEATVARPRREVVFTIPVTSTGSDRECMAEARNIVTAGRMGSFRGEVRTA